MNSHRQHSGALASPYVVPPVVAGFVGAVASVLHRIIPILLESSIELPSARTLSFYAVGGRFAAFVLVFGLGFGLAFWVGRQRDGASADGMLALATGVVGAVTYFVGTGAVLLWLGPERGLFVNALVMVVFSTVVGVQLAVVTFAGATVARRH